MSDRLEEIKKASIGTYEVTPNQVEWLIAEVERLANIEYQMKRDVAGLQGMDRERKKQIESLQSQLAFAQSVADKEKATKEKLVLQLAAVEKERDELKEEVKHEIEVSGRNVGLYRKLEAENAELKTERHVLKHALKLSEQDNERIISCTKPVYKKVEDLTAKLTASEKETAELKELAEVLKYKLNLRTEEIAKLQERVSELEETARNYRIRLSNYLRKEPKTGV